jgi:DNA modification methylase
VSATERIPDGGGVMPTIKRDGDPEKQADDPVFLARGGPGEGGVSGLITTQDGDALDLIQSFQLPIDLVVTDPPYAFGGSGGEHALSATVAVVLRESAQRLRRGSWMVVFAASSWRSTAYMVESVRGILDPVRIGTWTKPEARTKVAGSGWRWASVNVIAFRKGKGRDLPASDLLDHVCAAPVRNGRRAELPAEVAEWAVRPFVVPGGVFLDPFAGSGALPIAADRAGMHAFGFERALEPAA